MARSVLKDALGRPIPLDGELRVWLDDDLEDRAAPEGWVHLVTSREVCFMLLTGRVVEISLDNDLNGDDRFGLGYQVAEFLLQELIANERMLFPRDGVTIHSANPSGRDRMLAAFRSAERYGVQVDEQITGGGKPRILFS